MRIWFREIKDSRPLQNQILEDLSEDTRTHKVFGAIEKICHDWDLAVPIWLDSNVAEFKRRSVTRFNQDNFIDEIEFDYLEIRVLEED